MTLSFEITEDKCTRCGLCGKDCPVKIITLQTGAPRILPANQELCIKCQHCLAVCPNGALSIMGLSPEQSVPVNVNSFPEPNKMEALIKGRRSVRYYHDENLPADTIRKLIDVASYAPTGFNSRSVRFSVIDDKQVLAEFREKAYDSLAKLVSLGHLSETRSGFSRFVDLWQNKREDVLFRGAPHLLITSAPKKSASPVPDCLIALAYFEMFAQSLGVGTVWNGLVKRLVDQLVPSLRMQFGIPEHHIIGYAMGFGRPAIQYSRAVQHPQAEVLRLSI
ncbi:MAG: nitroreductase family protein [Deltaproteobacteria bacterium]|nr:nitroreductase family protein [Deltaproteobacteria bacterium]